MWYGDLSNTEVIISHEAKQTLPKPMERIEIKLCQNPWDGL